MRLDTLKWNDHTFKALSKEAKLIYCFLEAHCSTAGFLQADESDIANGIGIERRSSLNPFGNVVVLAMEELEDSGFIVLYDNGEKDGPYKEWNNRGVLIAEGTYDQGMEIGLNKTWTNKGVLNKVVDYKADR